MFEDKNEYDMTLARQVIGEEMNDPNERVLVNKQEHALRRL